jgi:CRISPR-associated protein Cas2
MDILVAYDVSTLTSAGRRRLRNVAKICQGHGQRVQFSLFECSVNEAQMVVLRSRLLKAISTEEDNLRIYTLRGKREDVVESYGRDAYINFRAPLIV